MIGTLVIDEIPFAISRVAFEAGQMVFYAATDRTGVTVHSATDISLFAPDGSLVAHWRPPSGSPARRAHPGQMMTARVPLILLGSEVSS